MKGVIDDLSRDLGDAKLTILSFTSNPVSLVDGVCKKCEDLRCRLTLLEKDMVTL